MGGVVLQLWIVSSRPLGSRLGREDSPLGYLRAAAALQRRRLQAVGSVICRNTRREKEGRRGRTRTVEVASAAILAAAAPFWDRASSNKGSNFVFGSSIAPAICATSSSSPSKPSQTSSTSLVTVMSHFTSYHNLTFHGVVVDVRLVPKPEPARPRNHPPVSTVGTQYRRH